MNKIVLLLAFAALALTSCKRKPAATAPVEADKNMAELKTALASESPAYEWLRMRTRVEYEDPSQKQSAAALIKMKDDSIIWASVNVMVEVVRAQITNDSAMMMNRLAREYDKFPTAELTQLLPIEGLDLKALQNLILAYPPFGIKEGTKLEKNEASYTLAYQTPVYEETMEIDAATLRMSKYTYRQSESKHLNVYYSDFKEVSGGFYPGKIQFVLQVPDKIALTLDISEYGLAETDETSFTIPESYQRKP